MVEAAAPLLRVEHLTMRFGGLVAVDDLSFDVAKGTITALIGPNGAGKTTVFNCITGFYKPTAGLIRLEHPDGRAYLLERLLNFRVAKLARVARTFQNIRLFSDMTVWQHLLVAQPHTGPALRSLLPMRLANPQVSERAEEMLDFFGLGAVRSRLARSLPYGLQRKVEMARAVAARPKLLLLDEPVAGMNHDEAATVRELVLSLRRSGLSILLIEHDMAFVMNLCDHLYVLDFGVLIAQGRPDEIRANPAVLDAYLGQAA